LRGRGLLADDDKIRKYLIDELDINEEDLPSVFLSNNIDDEKTFK
jgi:hypothetical protein